MTNKLIFVPTKASQMQKQVRRADTAPELALRRALHASGARYRLHQRIVARFTADIVFSKKKIAVFVDGCFWHGCPRHGQRNFRGPNASQWPEKIRRNKERDCRVTRMATEAGWRVIRIWECEINEDLESSAELVLSALNVDR